jgi:hypothetical protein
MGLLMAEVILRVEDILLISVVFTTGEGVMMEQVLLLVEVFP